MASEVENTALYVDDDVTFTVRRQHQFPTTGDRELVIETQFSGTNPADIKHATFLGIYPAVLGYDFCGKVLEASAGSIFQAGDLVAGCTPTGIGRPAKFGAHQRYMVCPEDMAFPVPDGLPPHHAACLTVVTMTAADTLYNIFNFPQPHENPVEKTLNPLLIWGASSSVGLCAIQLARASGIYPIIVTASPERHDLLKELGATHCFNYKSPNVCSEIRAAMFDGQWGPLNYGFDAVGSKIGDISSANLLAQCVSEEATLASVTMQSGTRFKMPFATPGRDVTVRVPNSPSPISIPARPADFQRAWSALRWSVDNYGIHFRFPSVDVFDGTAEEALEEVKLLASHGRGFGKLVLKHPLH